MIKLKNQNSVRDAVILNDGKQMSLLCAFAELQFLPTLEKDDEDRIAIEKMLLPQLRNFKIVFGKHEGKTLEDIYQNDFEYLVFLTLGV